MRLEAMWRLDALSKTRQGAGVDPFANHSVEDRGIVGEDDLLHRDTGLCRGPFEVRCPRPDCGSTGRLWDDQQVPTEPRSGHREEHARGGSGRRSTRAKRMSGQHVQCSRGLVVHGRARRGAPLPYRRRTAAA